MITIRLTAEELEYIARPITGEGGWQDTLRMIRTQTTDGVLSVTKQEAERIIRHAEAYGEGGFENRLLTLAGRLRRLLAEGAE